MGCGEHARLPHGAAGSRVREAVSDVLRAVFEA
jgi:hypothetical protein